MQTVGLHVEEGRLYTVLLTKEKKTVRVDHSQILSDVKQLYILPKFKKKEHLIATGLPCQEVVTRSLSFQLKSKTTLLKALPFQLESAIPFPPDETVTFCLFHKKEGKERPITLFATKLPFLERHLDEWRQHQITPDTVSCAPNALHRFANHTYPQEPSLFLFYFGKEQSTWLVLQDNRIVLSQSLGPLSKNTLDQHLARIKQFIQNKLPNFSSLPFALCGPEANPSLFTSHFGQPLPATSLSPFAVPFGLALDALLQDSRSVEWRISPKRKNCLKRLLYTYLASSLFLASLFAAFHTYHLKQKKSALEQKLSTILERPVTLFEGLDALEEESSLPQETTALIPNIPLVADVLQWIGAHPLLKQKGMEISRFHYQLEHFPKLGEKKEPYRASVELEITVSSPTAAREFHNALLKGDSLVDPKKEITWKTSHNAYYTKFYLKSKR